MKKLKLIFSRIKSDYAVGKGMFILYLAGVLLSVLVFIYFYGNLLPTLHDVNNILNREERRTYCVYLESPLPMTEDVILTPFEGQDVEKITVCAEYSDEEKGLYMNISSVGSNVDIEDALLTSCGKNNLPVLSDEQFSENIVIMGSGLEYDESTIEINGKSFEVIKTENNSECLMPQKAFLSMGFESQYFSVVLKNKLNTDENLALLDDINAYFSEKFPNAGVSADNPLAGELDKKDSQILIYFLELCLIYGICFICCALLFNYIYKRNLYENVIYMIIGAKRRLIFFIAVAETAILSFGISLCAVLIHAALYNTVFKSINEYTVSYTITDYLIVIAFTTLLSVIIMLPFFIRTLKYSVISLKNKYI